MKKLFWKTLGGLALMSLLCGSVQAQGRVGTVDLRKVFDNYWRRQQADAAIKARVADMEKDFKGMVEDYNKSKDDYQKLLESANDQAVSSEERERRKKDAETKLKQLKDTEDTLMTYKRESEARVKEQLKRMRDSILAEIQAVIKAKAEAGNFSMVFDSAAVTPNETPILLYVSNKENDLTDVVLKQLNATTPADALKGSGSSSSGNK